MPPPNVPAPPATQGDEDPASPTVLLQNYLRTQGKPLNGGNMRTLLDAVHRGDVKIAGLNDVDTPSTDPNVGQSGNVAAQVEKAPTGRNLPEPPIPPQGDNQNTPPQASNTSETSNRLQMNLAPLILGGMGLAGGAYGLNRMLNSGSPASSAQPTPSGDVPPPPDVAPPPVGDRFAVQPPPQGAAPGQPPPTDMEVQMQRAVAPQGPPPPPMPPEVNPAAVMNATGGPPGGVPPGPRTMVGPNSPTGVVANPPPAPGTTVQDAAGRIMPRPPIPNRTLDIPPPPIRAPLRPATRLFLPR